MNHNIISSLGIGLLTVALSVGTVQAAESKSVFKPNQNVLVHYNWGSGAPIGFPKDHFTAIFDQSKTYQAGDYFIQTHADDGVKVEVDGKWMINRWENSSPKTDRALWLGVTGASHSVKTHYYENKGNAVIFSDIVKFDSWLAYYYPNKELKGSPTAAKVFQPSGELKKLSVDAGKGSPAAGVPSNNYSARYTSAKRIPAGDYIVRTKADDGVRIKIDGKTVLNRWTPSKYREDTVKIHIKDQTTSNPNEKDVHWIEVEYFEDGGDSKLEFSLEAFVLAERPEQKGGEVHYNWGKGSPLLNIPSDYFTAVFDQTREFQAGDYFIQTLADDGVKVEVDQNWLINRWEDSSPKTDRALWLGVTGATHTVKTHYYENKGDAIVFSDIVPIDSWLAYYYPNKYLNGNPVTAKVLDPGVDGMMLSENFGKSSPAAGIPVDNFSAKYTTAKRISAGDYVLRLRADDGVKVYLDGKLVLNRWTGSSYKEDALVLNVQDRKNVPSEEKEIHWLEVHYFEATGGARIDASLQPLNEVIATDDWVGYVYPNKSLLGVPAILGGNGAQHALTDIDFKWGNASPSRLIPADQFSARFVKTLDMKAGTYQFKTWSDDGVRVYLDKKLIIDSWVNSSTDYKDTFAVVEDGEHEIIVEYFDNKSWAELKFEIVNLIDTPSTGVKYVSFGNLPVYRSFEELSDYGKHLVYYSPSYSRYFTLNYGEMVFVLEEKLYATKIQTLEGKVGWVQKPYLENSLRADLWLVKEGRTLRASSMVNSMNLGFIPDYTKVRVLDYVSKNESNSDWYQIETESGSTGWIWGAINTASFTNYISGEYFKNTGLNIIKYEFEKLGKTTNEVSIFTPLNTTSTITAEQINRYIDVKTGGQKTGMSGLGEAFIIAQKESGLNAIYLLAHAGHETAWGRSSIVRDKFNFYGIGAIDSQPEQGAFNFDSPSGGIIAGAIWISSNYVIRDWDTDDKLPFYQPTLDNMKFDNSYHHYATDEAWAVKIAHYAEEINKYFK